MHIKVLGTGCPKCNALYKVVVDVIQQNDIDATIEKIEDVVEIVQYGMLQTPALVINESVVAKGSVPTADQIKKLLLKK